MRQCSLSRLEVEQIQDWQVQDGIDSERRVVNLQRRVMSVSFLAFLFSLVSFSVVAIRERFCGVDNEDKSSGDSSTNMRTNASSQIASMTVGMC